MLSPLSLRDAPALNVPSVQTLALTVRSYQRLLRPEIKPHRRYEPTPREEGQDTGLVGEP